MSEHTAFIGLGSNLGDRLRHLAAAREALSEWVTVERTSSVYETEPVDLPDQPWFLNQVLLIRCTLAPFALLDACLTIEHRLGRVRSVPKGPRTIDLDILLYDDLIIDEERDGHHLAIPHPRLHLRRFVLVPLCELAPDRKHPILGRTMTELLASVPDEARVRPYAAPGGP